MAKEIPKHILELFDRVSPPVYDEWIESNTEYINYGKYYNGPTRKICKSEQLWMDAPADQKWLYEMSLKDLRICAKKRGIKGCSSKRKAELREVLGKKE